MSIIKLNNVDFANLSVNSGEYILGVDTDNYPKLMRGNDDVLILGLTQSFSYDNYEDITYSNFVYKLYNSELRKGTYYILTDYSTIYYIYKSLSGDKDTMYGDVEPIVILATSENTYSGRVYSTVYPNDIIFWVHDILDGEYNYVGGVGKGCIIYRESINGNVASFDFRNVKFRRFESSTGVYEGFYSDYAISSNYHDYLCFDDVNATNLKILKYTNNKLPNIVLLNGMFINVEIRGENIHIESDNITNSVIHASNSYIYGDVVDSNIKLEYSTIRMSKDSVVSNLVDSNVSLDRVLGGTMSNISGTISNVTFKNMNNSSNITINDSSLGNFENNSILLSKLNNIDAKIMVNNSFNNVTINNLVATQFNNNIINNITFSDNKINYFNNNDISTATTRNFTFNDINNFNNNRLYNVETRENSFNNFIGNIVTYSHNTATYGIYRNIINSMENNKFHNRITPTSVADIPYILGHNIIDKFTNNTIQDYCFVENTITHFNNNRFLYNEREESTPYYRCPFFYFNKVDRFLNNLVSNYTYFVSNEVTSMENSSFTVSVVIEQTYIWGNRILDSTGNKLNTKFFRFNNIGTNFDNNNFDEKSKFEYNTVGNYFRNNTFTNVNFNNNTINNNCRNNKFINNNDYPIATFSMNNFKDDFNWNTFSSYPYVLNNNLDTFSHNNIISNTYSVNNKFNNNKLNNFTNNKIFTTPFTYNVVDSFYNNNVGTASLFTYNSIKNINNTFISNTFSYNNIAMNIESCTFSASFSDNFLASSIRNQII